MRTVIIGGGSAGVSAATHLRRQNENAEIIIIEKSDEFAVASCGLPRFLSGKIKNKSEIIGATVKQMKDIFQIDVWLNTEVFTINPAIKQLNLSNNKKIGYDKLIIAAGSLQLRPDISGILRDNIFTLHNLASAQKIIDYFWGLNAKKIIILGGSPIGLSVAQALTENKAQVLILDKAPHILSHVDLDFGRLIVEKIQHKNLTVLTNTTVKEFRADKAVLTDGKQIEYDMAIVATGSKSEIRLPIMADINIGKTGGIIVDANMRTSLPDIFACGDNIELKDLITNLPVRPENAVTTIHSAKVAADNATDVKNQMENLLNNEMIEISNYVIGSCGCNEEELKRADMVYNKLYLAAYNCESYTAQAEKMFFKLLFDPNGRILGVQALGKKGIYSRLNIIATMIKYQRTVQDMAEMPLGYLPHLGKAKDAVNILGSLAQEINSNNLKTAKIDDLTETDVLLDVCSATTFKQKYKHQALNIPLTALRQNLINIPKNRKIVITCNGGYAAYLAYKILIQRGFNQVFWLNSCEIWQ